MSVVPLSHDSLYHIFSFLNEKELVKAGEVCKEWHSLSEEEIFWKPLLARRFNIIEKSVEKLSWKGHMQLAAVFEQVGKVLLTVIKVAENDPVARFDAVKRGVPEEDTPLYLSLISMKESYEWKGTFRFIEFKTQMNHCEAKLAPYWAVTFAKEIMRTIVFNETLRNFYFVKKKAFYKGKVEKKYKSSIVPLVASTVINMLQFPDDENKECFAHDIVSDLYASVSLPDYFPAQKNSLCALACVMSRYIILSIPLASMHADAIKLSEKNIAVMDKNRELTSNFLDSIIFTFFFYARQKLSQLTLLNSL